MTDNNETPPVLEPSRKEALKTLIYGSKIGFVSFLVASLGLVIAVVVFWALQSSPEVIGLLTVGAGFALIVAGTHRTRLNRLIALLEKES